MNSPDTQDNPQKQIFLHDPDAIEEKLDILEYWRSITKRKWSILALGLAVAMVAAVIAYVTTPVYRSTATVLIEKDQPRLLPTEAMYGGFSENYEHFQTQAEIIQMREVALRAITKLKLWEHPEFDPRKQKKSAFTRLLDSIGFTDNITPAKTWNETELRDAIYGNFVGRRTVEPVRRSQLIKISFDSADKELAARMANALSEAYIENDLDSRYKMTRQASTWLQESLTSLRQKLEASERALQDYRDRTGIVDVKGAAQSGAGSQIMDVTQRLVETRIRRAEVENAYNQIKNARPGTDLRSFPAVVRNPVVGDAIKQESEAERKLAELSQRYGKEHPKIVQAESEVKSSRENVRRQVDNVVASVTREYEVARGMERTLEGALAQARGMVQNINRKEFQLGVLEREVESNRQMHDMFMKRAKETNVPGGNLQTAVARIVDPATAPGWLVKPQKERIILIAFMLGLFAGVLATLLIDRLDNTLKTTEDVENKLKQPLLTSLPLLLKEDAERTHAARLFLDQNDSIYSEAIRTARTGVLLSAIDLPNRILLVTSSLPGEGKTTFAINLALAHAHTKKTLLIDADMRRPTVAKNLDLAPGSKGLSNLVSGTAKLGECLHTIPGSTLSVIPSGTYPPNPLELLLSQKFRETLDRLGQEFDIIVLDSPPVELVSDALVISAHASGVIYVVKAVGTPYPLARKGIARINQADGSILGVVLNGLDFKKAEKYYGEYSGYGKYGSKGGYGATYGSENIPATKAG